MNGPDGVTSAQVSFDVCRRTMSAASNPHPDDFTAQHERLSGEVLSSIQFLSLLLAPLWYVVAESSRPLVDFRNTTRERRGDWPRRLIATLAVTATPGAALRSRRSPSTLRMRA